MEVSKRFLNLANRQKLLKLKPFLNDETETKLDTVVMARTKDLKKTMALKHKGDNTDNRYYGKQSYIYALFVLYERCQENK